MLMTTMTPEFLQQLMLATLLADRSEEDGTEYEDGTYEQGVRDALQWVAGLLAVPPHNPQEFPSLSMPLASAQEYLNEQGAMEFLRVATTVDVKSGCKEMGPTCRGCPDCMPVMGDATYREMFPDAL